MKVFDFNTMQNLNLTAAQMYNWVEDAWKYKKNILLPPKVKMWQGESGRYITMPCVIPSLDIAGVKFICRNVDSYDGIPARNSNIMLQKCSETGLLAVFDGVYITNMRTGAIAAYSVLKFAKKDFSTMGIVGLGLVARAFFWIFGELYKHPVKIKLFRYKNQAEEFIERFKKYTQFTFEICDTHKEICGCDVVVSGVNFIRDIFCDVDVYQNGCTVVPIHTAGFQNCDLVFEKIFVDDTGHVMGYKYYEEFKHKCVEIPDMLDGKSKGRENEHERILIYCGGTALHDLYFAYQIYQLANNVPDIKMNHPEERFWI